MIKIKADSGSAPPAYTYIEGLITLRKLEAVQTLVKNLMDDFDLVHH